MNCTKFVPPLPSYVNFYYYYSYLTLLISLTITPLQFYVILTKSQNLNGLKWLIFNHTIWCLLFEIVFTTVKPVLLFPSLAGFPLGLLRNSSLKVSAFGFYSILIILSTNLGALETTLICRYLMVFPATKWFSNKLGIFLTILFLIATYTIITVLFYPLFVNDNSKSYKMALDFDPCLKEIFLTEPGFYFLSGEIASNILYFLFSFLILAILFSIVVVIFFIYLAKTTPATKFRSSLLISSIIQLSISICFNFIPVAVSIGIMAMQIFRTENIMIVLFCCLSSHSFLESFATLYFVRPYRKSIVKMFNQFLKNSVIKNPTQMSVVSNIAVMKNSLFHSND